jgi:hypothetical protein
MNFRTVLLAGATFACFGNAQAQDAAMQGQAPMPEACLSGPATPDHGMAAPSANLSEHQAAMMQGMMATSDQMLQGMMAEDPDIAFACGMIPHHQAAINMAKAELEYGDDDRMKEMAQTIIDAQTKEMEELTSWVEEHAK